MKINLRKASAVQDAIQDEIRRISDEDTAVSISLFDQNPQMLMDQQLQRFTDGFEQAVRFMEAYKFLRATVARKNAEAGIADYLAEDSMLAAMEPRLERITRMNLRPDLAHLDQELAARRSTADEKVGPYGSGREFSITVNVMDETTQAQARGELEKLRRRRRKIRDEMVAINVKTEFEVPEQVAMVLTELGLD